MNSKFFSVAAAAMSLSMSISAQSPATGTIGGHEYVDLGLSVKWATCNVGAAKPEDYGDYFAWGDTTVVEEYTYGDYSYHGFFTNSKLDAATYNWGQPWRRPTPEEMQELLQNCTWQWITLGEHQGYKIIGPNGNSIFLPAAGSHYGASVYNVGSWGNYWLSRCYTDDECRILQFYNGYHHECIVTTNHQRSIRPVSE